MWGGNFRYVRGKGAGERCKEHGNGPVERLSGCNRKRFRFDRVRRTLQWRRVGYRTEQQSAKSQLLVFFEIPRRRNQPKASKRGLTGIRSTGRGLLVPRIIGG